MSHTRNAETIISKDASKIPVYIIPTDEELVMTEDAHALIAGTYDIHTKFTYSFQSRDYVNKGRAEGLKIELAKHPELQTIIAVPG
jgi:acetate kinase